MDGPDNFLYDLDMDVSLFISAGGRTWCTAETWDAENVRAAEARFYLPRRGTGWVALDGQRTTLEPEHGYLIPPHVHLSHAATPGVAIDWVHFHASSALLDARLSVTGRIHTFAPEDLAGWREACATLPDALRADAPALHCHAHAFLLHAVGRALEASADAAWPAERLRLLPALRMMDDPAMRQPSLADLARSVPCSGEHFHRLFVAAFHMTPFRYMLTRRLARACALLASGGLRVGEVAHACGFDDPYYFSRVFKRHYGCTPRDIRAGRERTQP